MEFDKLYAELVINAETIRALVKGISEEDALVKPTPEDWSIFEVVCHLYDEEINDFRPRLDIILHRSSEPFAPNGDEDWLVKHNGRKLGDVLDDFLAERQKSLVWLKDLAHAQWDVSYTTPYRTMTAGDMFTSWVAHDTLHLRQLVELRHARIVRLSEPHITDYAGDW